MKIEYWSLIKFPDEGGMMRSAREFEEKGLLYGAQWMPKILGAVDGTHINIKAPHFRPESYVNRKGELSLNVQACVNSSLEFIHLYVGAPGRVHDQNVFDNSGLEALIPENWMILDKRDGGYRATRKVLTPFRENGRLSAKQEDFNKIQSSLRKVVERAFGVLKRRFKILKYLDYDDMCTMKHIIIVCCLFHNLDIQSADEFRDNMDNDFEDYYPDDDDSVDEGTFGDFKNALVARMLPDSLG
ncbi:putative nuclease HARBI1 [Paramacrobiotus metropolitanus]|uniref:putative nuclease HARBI1 n=1 Tax=Paramacrobiotus metropolitanus TaxID=2943436 RepID=UPI00244589D4|nr:putative nuclease HARBI1 [Paramacrobiotus metropolitanus]